MKNFITIDGKQIELSEETIKNIKAQLEVKETPSSEIGIDYKQVSDIDWENKQEILIKDKPEKKIFYNQKFANNSVFGDNCVFIKCKFGGFCEFGSYCEFGSCCEFGSGCEFGSDCEFGGFCEKQFPYWDEKGKHNS